MAVTTELTAAITQYIENREVWDALETRHALTDWATGDGKKQQIGGLYIQIPIKLMANTAQGAISGTNAIVSGTPSEQLRYGTAQWKYYNWNINFTLQDFNVAAGKEEQVNFMTEKTTGALADFMRDISSLFHASSASAALNPDGLKDMFAASGTAYLGLTDTTYASGAYLPILDSTTQTVNYNNINLNYNKLQARLQKEMAAESLMCLMNQSTYSKYQASVQTQQRFTSAKIFETGSEGFHINNMDVFMDSYVPGTQDGSTADNYCYIFPKEIIRLYYHFGFGTKSPFDGDVKLPLSPILSIQHYISWQFINVNRRLGVLMSTLVA
jgi:hypothetical protein